LFFFYLFHSESRVCLSRGVQVAGAAWRAAMRTMAGVGDLVQRTGDGRTGRVLGGRAVKRSVGFLVEPQNQGGGGFPGLGLKTGSSGLVIWASKSPRRFLSLGLKTMHALVCRLRHKTNGGRSARDTRRDLAACLAWKQVRLGFPSLA
jgi:hypothetical protein